MVLNEPLFWTCVRPIIFFFFNYRFQANHVYFSGGEKSLGIPVFVEYPLYDSRTHTQKFPFRSLAMLAALFAQLIVSFVTRNLLGGAYLPRCCDPLDVYAPGGSKNPNGVVPSSSGAALLDCAMNVSFNYSFLSFLALIRSVIGFQLSADQKVNFFFVTRFYFDFILAVARIRRPFQQEKLFFRIV